MWNSLKFKHTCEVLFREELLKSKIIKLWQNYIVNGKVYNNKNNHKEVLQIESYLERGLIDLYK